ncbi:hypothetical protein LO762_22440 [Actinocorallia sp. API 0066]|uniref:hypothetical protein n=1 Tax=Actinocorallia sp. API 0066 TaxID=2896846 RepID=UPI001E4AF102|nr:hypothetical protein [Actinocorallia sp. API 0066]MCD0451931.1 hypothetical protein [Actinocorallia sp. API 0066]
MVSMTFDAGRDMDPVATVTLRSEAWEINIRAIPAEFARLAAIRDTDWETSGSIGAGTCAGAPAFWVHHQGNAVILVGQDDETWDFAVTIPLSLTDEIAQAASTAVPA